MKNIEWWRFTAYHMWNTYFTLRQQQQDALTQNQVPPEISDALVRIYEICDCAYQNNFTERDQKILHMYFTSRWQENLKMIKEFSKKNKVSVNTIWMVIRRASRDVVEEIGLLDRKDEVDGDG